jgi:hypothetical protein
MLVYVPQLYVALVYVGSELRAVLESGVNYLAPLEGMSLQYVDLRAAAAPQQTEAVDAVH